MMKKYLYYIMCVFFLSSCSSQVPITNEITKPPIQKPRPIQVEKVKWSVEDGNICLSATDGIRLNTQLKDTIRYIKNLQSRLCYYGDTQYCKEETK